MIAKESTETINKLCKNTSWVGNYKGVQYSIENFRIGDDWDAWTLYLWVDLGMIPAAANPGSFWLEPRIEKLASGAEYVRYDYYHHPVIGGVKWNGCTTWYSKELGLDGGSARVVKFGCDFQHSWDRDRQYDLVSMIYYAQKAVDSFLVLVPGYGEKKT